MTAQTTSAISPASHRNWRAKLDLHYQLQDSRTILADRQHYGPLLVQKPFYPETNGCCHTYIVHPPGGIVGGDQLRVHVNCDTHSHVLLTTPAATKFYRSVKDRAQAHQLFHVSENACLEWLPQETVYFNGSIVDNHTQIHLAKNAQLFAWDIQCLGLPASDAPYQTGDCIQRLSVYRQQRPILLECNRFTGGSDLLSSHAGLQNFQALGTLVATASNTELIDLLRNQKDWFQSPLLVAFTQLNGLLICRVLANFSYQIVTLFKRIWAYSRPILFERDAVEPRIWST